MPTAVKKTNYFLFSFSFSLVWAVLGSSFLCRPFQGSFGVVSASSSSSFSWLSSSSSSETSFLVVFSLFAGFGRSCESDVSELSDCPDLLEEDVELSSDELNSCNSRFRCGLTQVAVAEEEDLEPLFFEGCFQCPHVGLLF